MTGRTMWHQRRHRVAAAGIGWRCAYCGVFVECATCFPETASPATLDHIVPRSAGGSGRVHNLALACRVCNEAKADALPPKPGMAAVGDVS